MGAKDKSLLETYAMLNESLLEKKKTDKNDDGPVNRRRFKSEWQITYEKVKDILPDKVVEKIKSVM